MGDTSSKLPRMTGLDQNIGPSSTRRRVAAIVALIGILFVGSRLARAWPREVTIVYEVGPAVTELHLDYLQQNAAVSSARLQPSRPNSGVFRHTVRLQPGDYRVHITLYGGGAAAQAVRGLSVPSVGLTRIDLKEASRESE